MIPGLTVSDDDDGSADNDHDHTYPCKGHFVAQVVETTNAVLGIFVVVVLDKPEAG